MTEQGTKIDWHLNRETRYPFGVRSPDPARFDPIGFPPPWPDRPWIFAVMVASANRVLGIVAIAVTAAALFWLWRRSRRRAA